MTVDVGKLTPNETADLLKECIQALSEERLFESLNSALTTAQREELGERWFNLDREGV